MFNKEIHPLNQLEFPDTREKWKNAPIEITINQLLIDGHPVMETWEDAYMKQLAAIAASSGGVVLEVGFGLGISAAFIQEHSVSEHWIIEANASVFKNLLEFNEIYPNVKPLFGFWQEVTPPLPDASFDGILFDTYPISQDELHTARFSFFAEAYRLLKPGGVFTHYSGEVEFTSEYKGLLNDAGFAEFTGDLVDVSPPAGCLYWDEKHLLAPRIIKGNSETRAM